MLPSDDAAAVEQFQRSVKARRSGRSAVLLADTHRRLARLLAARGDRGAARAHVEDGLALLSRWPGPLRTDLEAMRRRIGDPERTPDALFTAREHEVLKVLAQGCSNSEIADRLFISRKTVSTHISNLLAKTGFANRTQVASWAIREGLVEMPR